MKGTILDFLKLAAEKPELADALVGLPRKHDFEFSDEVSDVELDHVSGGVDQTKADIMESLTGGGLPDGLDVRDGVCITPMPSAPPRLDIPW